MARPIKIFTPLEASHLVRTFWLKSNGSDWFDFSRNLKTPDLSSAAKHALDVIFQAMDDQAAPAALRLWIDTFLSPEGWKRVQAAARQHKAFIKNRDAVTKMDKSASWDFSYLAKQVDMTKKDYLSQLARWMLNDDVGRKAAVSFDSYLKVIHSRK